MGTVIIVPVLVQLNGQSYYIALWGASQLSKQWCEWEEVQQSGWLSSLDELDN